MKSHTRLLVSIVMISIVANATACSKKIEAIDGKEFNTEVAQVEIVTMPTFEEKIEITEPIVAINNVDNNIIENDIIENIPIEPSVIETSVEQVVEESIIEKSLEDILKETLYDENIDYQLVVKTYLSTDYDKRENLKNDYLRALYMLMINSNVPMSTYINELNTLMIMQQIPMCVPDDVWYQSFGNLIALDPECLSLYEMYIDMAMYIHNLNCDNNHYLNDYYGYSCEDLEKEYTRRLEIPEI